MPRTPPVILTFPSDLIYLPIARAMVESICRLAGMDGKCLESFVLAVNEATSNVIRHAHKDRVDLAVQLECHVTQEQIEVRLLDQGEPFDLSGVPSLDPSELRCGGRGVYLMRALLDELTITARTGGGNVLRMVKRFRSSPSTS